MTNLVVAGGAVLRALLLSRARGRRGIDELGSRHIRAADVDLWIVADDADAARETFERVLAHVAAKYRDVNEVQRMTSDVLVVRSKYCVTLAGPWPARHVQIITRHYRNARRILYNFDVDACQFAYDVKAASSRPCVCVCALLTGVNVYDPERSSPHSLYEKRLLSTRRTWDLRWPFPASTSRA